ncbi:cytochrome b [Thiocystis violascens]|uniref:Cytochrome B561 n=1 Tax=Thiocystis violascens (strain ATCC 17096 / DSM 198 / 6111) TaxID=765911 RepID=I3Y7J4_THIV6|nr:cytochrome b/b6 domain-containing protein [Thiocystis violascens]AFL72962.1 cytochrome B561 [Thiocystis violascens DSM 198]
MTIQRYTLLQRLLHWLIALMVFGLLAAGFTFWSLGYEGTVGLFGEELTNMLYKIHKTFGILLLLLMIARIALRRVSPAPPHDPPLSGVERMVGGGIHLLLYALLIGLPIGGWLATAASGYPIQFFDLTLPGIIGENKELGATLFFYHGIGGLVVLGLVLVHTAAGLKHWRLKDGIMTRISLP